MTFLRSILASSILLAGACSDDGVPVAADSATDGDASGTSHGDGATAASSAVTTNSGGTSQGSGSDSDSSPTPTATASGTSGTSGAGSSTGGLDSTGTGQESGATGSTGADPTGSGSTGAGSTGGGSTGTGTTGTTGSTGSGSTGGALLPNGASCSADDECESNQCYAAGLLGGFCGECNEDADCDDGGCTAPDIVADPVEGSVCNMGELGGGCETVAVCEPDLECVLIVDIPGVVSLQTCSACSDDNDCGGDMLCSPIADTLQPDAYNACVAPGTIGEDAACDFTGSGDEACASGYCVAADVQGVAQIGVCGECETDGDCPGAQTCSDPEVDLSGSLIGSTCG